jgi:hypothetical protein
MRASCFVICAALLAACSSPPTWQKAGASETDVKEALQDCRMKARLSPQQHVGALEPRGAGTPGMNRIEDRDAAEAAVIQRCMREKGYAAGTR